MDLDPLRAAGISATTAEHATAHDLAKTIIDHLAADGWPCPIYADSGNGAHLMYRIDLPTDDGGLVQRCLSALDARFSTAHVKVDLTTFNPARIWKLYGTPSCKGDSTPERPHRVSRIIDVPQPLNVVPTDLLAALAGPAPEPTRNGQAAGNGRAHGATLDLWRWLAEHGIEHDEPRPWQGGTKAELRKCPFSTAHTDGAFVAQLSNGAIVAKCQHNSCSGRGWRDLRELHELGYQQANGQTRQAAAATKPRRPPTIEAYRPFPVDALPEPVRGFVVAGAKAIGCDASYIGLPLLSELAAAIGNSRRIRLKRGWEEPAIVWTAILGESGTAKSPAMSLAMRPIEAAQQRAMRAYQSAADEYERARLEYERDLAAWKKAKHGGDPPAKPDEPVPERYVCDDTTVEALAPLLDHQPRGLLMYRDELAGWLASFDRYSASGKSGGDVAKWLELFGGRRLLVDRKSGTRRTIYVPRASVSVAGGIQPDTLRRSMTADFFANGLAARLLLAWPPRKPKHWTEADVTREVEADVVRVVEGLLALPPDVDEHGDARPIDLPLTRAGRAAWIDYFAQHAAEQVELAGDLAAAWSKLEGYAARLALIVHCVRLVAGDATLASPDAVDEASIVSGVALSRWFGGEARRVYAMLGESDVEARDRRLVEWITARGGEVTARQLQQGHRGYGTAADAETALAELVEAERGAWESVEATDKGGRPTRVFRLFRPSTVYETPPNPEKNVVP